MENKTINISEVTTAIKTVVTNIETYFYFVDKICNEAKKMIMPNE